MMRFSYQQFQFKHTVKLLKLNIEQMGNNFLQPNSQVKSSQIIFERQQDLLQNIIFIQNRQVENQDLGLHNIQIFRFKEPPYQYIMKHTKIFQQQSLQAKQYLGNLRVLTKIAHRNIAQIFYIKNWVQNSMCLRTVNIDNYSAFYGIQLRQIIYQRKIKDCRFQQSQVYYVLKSLISIGSCLKKMEICFGLFQSKNIYISSQGYLKAYLYHIQSNNKHFNYNNIYCQKPSNLSKYIPFSPQFIPNLQLNKASSQNICPYKSDLFSIGMVIIEMLMDNQLIRYYKIGSISSLQFYHLKLKEDINNLKNLYSGTLINLIQNIVNPFPQQRWNYEQAQQYLIINCDKFTKGASLKMFDQEEENNKIKPKVSYKCYSSKSQNILKSIQTSLQNKLTVAPIKFAYYPDRRNSDLNLSSCKKTIYTRRSSHCGMQVISKNKIHKKIKIRNASSNTSTNSLFKNNQKTKSLISQYQVSQYPSHIQKGQNTITLTLGNTRISQDDRFTIQQNSNYTKKSQKLRIYQNYMSNHIQSSRISITPIKQLKNMKNKPHHQRRPNLGINIKANPSKSKIVLR